MGIGDRQHPAELTLGQAFGLARLAERAGTAWLFGHSASVDHDHVVYAWRDGELLHVLLSPPGDWVSLDRTGEEVARQAATRAEELTVVMRASRRWAGLRRALLERGIDPATTVVAEALDDDADEDFGVVVLHDGRVAEWRAPRAADEGADDLAITDWRDISSHWQSTLWAADIRGALEVRERGLLAPEA